MAQARTSPARYEVKKLDCLQRKFIMLMVMDASIDETRRSIASDEAFIERLVGKNISFILKG